MNESEARRAELLRQTRKLYRMSIRDMGIFSKIPQNMTALQGQTLFSFGLQSEYSAFCAMHGWITAMQKF